jgi:hypothetical protein
MQRYCAIWESPSYDVVVSTKATACGLGQRAALCHDAMSNVHGQVLYGAILLAYKKREKSPL